MYPEPHIPSAPTDRPLSDDGQLSDLTKRTLFVLSGSVVLFVVALSISVMRQVNLQCERDDPAQTEAQLVAADRADSESEPRFSSETPPTLLP